MELPTDKNFLVAGALTSNTLLRRFVNKEAEGGSEVLCWILLLLGSVLTNLRGVDADGAGIWPWVAAAGIALASATQSLENVHWILPALSLSLFLTRRLFLQPFAAPKVLTFAFDPNSLLCQLAVSALSLLVLLPTVGLASQVTCAAVVYLLASAGVWTALCLMDITQVQDDGLLDCSKTVGMARLVATRALPLVFVSTVLLVQLQGATITLRTGITILLAGFLKAVQWICLFSATRDVPWDILAPMSTFAVTISLSPSVFISFWHMAGYFLSSLATLTQTIAFIPSSSKSKLLLFGFMIIPGFTIIYTTGIRREGFIVLQGNPSIAKTKHPIEQLIAQSRAEFSATVERQSTTADDAMAEYRRRYGLDPPKGFEKWFEFAKDQDYVLIDEFDSIYDSFSPFWKFSAATLRKNMKQAPALDEHTSLCRYKDGLIKGDCGWHSNDIQLIMSSMAHRLPDFEFLLSTADGPRVVMSDDVEEALRDVRFEDFSGKNTWKPLTAPCRLQIERNSSRASSPQIDTHGLPFVQDIHGSKDICKHPEYADKHSLFLSPADAKFTQQAVPILSQAKASTNSDILIPSVYYFSSATGGKYNPANDPEWSKKTDGRLYWAGSNTGGVNHNGLWKNFQRHRFVSRTNRLGDQIETYLAETEPGIWTSYESSEHLSLFDVKFTAYIQCEPQRECKKQEKTYGRHGREKRPVMYRHKLNADVDGNGYSGRWYLILRSNGTPFKQTLYREWHDDHLFPWVHYVPMSLSLDEVPEMARFFSQTEAGQDRAKEIADASREWFGQAFRWADFQVYFYRVALEYARLLDEEREIIT